MRLSCPDDLFSRKERISVVGRSRRSSLSDFLERKQRSGFSQRAEVVFKYFRALRSENATRYGEPVVTDIILVHIYAGTAGSSGFVRRAENDSRNTRVHSRAETHRAGFESYVKRTAFQSPVSENTAGFFDCEKLRVSRGKSLFFAFIPRGRYYLVPKTTTAPMGTSPFFAASSPCFSASDI